MDWFLAYAEQTDLSGGELKTVLLCGGILAAACVLAFVVVLVAWSVRHRQAGTIMTAAVLWGLVTSASVMSLAVARQRWNREWDLRIRTGYADPADMSDKPRPWLVDAAQAIKGGAPIDRPTADAVGLALWVALGGAYVGLVVWASRGGGSVAVAAPSCQEPPTLPRNSRGGD